jgi:DNA repair exonuclease SbcCD ATPase subunit
MISELNSVKDLQRKTDQIDGFYQAYCLQEKELTETVDTLKKDIDRDMKASTVLKHLLDIMVKDEVARMAGLITYGLKTIFEDQNLTFTPEITKKNEKIYIELKTNNDGVEGGYKSFGGSVAVIESFLLRVLCLLKKKSAKLMILDETFAAVGKEYIANTGNLISELSKKIGLDVLLVTHQTEFQHNADHVYRVRESKNGLIMEKIK